MSFILLSIYKAFSLELLANINKRHSHIDRFFLGLTSTGNVTAKIKSDWSTCYAYVWNSVTGAKLKDWPGTGLNKNNGEFFVDIDISKYDSVIFTQTNSGPQTPDLLVTSFLNGDVYDLTSSINEQGMGFKIGTYI